MSVFLSPLACRNIWFYKPPAFGSSAWNVDVLYYRNLCICQRILWIPVRNGRCGDTIPLVLKKQRTIPSQHCGRACLMTKRIAPHAMSSATSERKTMYIACLDRYGRSVLPVAFVLYTPFGMSRWQAGRCAVVRFCRQLLFWNINRELQRYYILEPTRKQVTSLTQIRFGVFVKKSVRSLSCFLLFRSSRYIFLAPLRILAMLISSSFATRRLSWVNSCGLTITPASVYWDW